MMVLESNSGKRAMEVLISEYMPKMTKATNTRAVVTGFLTAVFIMLMAD